MTTQSTYISIANYGRGLAVNYRWGLSECDLMINIGCSAAMFIDIATGESGEWRNVDVANATRVVSGAFDASNSNALFEIVGEAGAVLEAIERDEDASAFILRLLARFGVYGEALDGAMDKRLLVGACRLMVRGITLAYNRISARDQELAVA